MTAASLSLYLDSFSVRIDFPKVHIAVSKMTFCLADVNIIGDVALEFVDYF